MVELYREPYVAVAIPPLTWVCLFVLEMFFMARAQRHLVLSLL